MEAVETRSNPTESKSKQDLTVATCKSGGDHKIRGLLNGIPRSLGFLRSGFIELERWPRRITGKRQRPRRRYGKRKVFTRLFPFIIYHTKTNKPALTKLYTSKRHIWLVEASEFHWLTTERQVGMSRTVGSVPVNTQKRDCYDTVAFLRFKMQFWTSAAWCSNSSNDLIQMLAWSVTTPHIGYRRPESRLKLRTQDTKHSSICRLGGSQPTNLLCDWTLVGPTNLVITCCGSLVEPRGLIRSVRLPGRIVDIRNLTSW